MPKQIAPKTFWKRLKHALKHQRMPITKLDVLIGSSQGYTSNLLKRKNFPRIDTAMRIADALGVSLMWLLTGEGEMGAELPPDDFVSRMELAMDRAGIGVAQLDVLVGSKPGYISNVRIRRSDPRLGSALKIADALGVRLRWLADGTGPMWAEEESNDAPPPDRSS